MCGMLFGDNVDCLQNYLHNFSSQWRRRVLMDRRSIPDVLKAAIRGDLDAAKTALDSVDLTKARNVYEDNLLHLTSDSNRPQVLAHILSRPDCKKLINQRNCIRRTPLHAACKAGSVLPSRLMVLMTTNASSGVTNKERSASHGRTALCQSEAHNWRDSSVWKKVLLGITMRTHSGQSKSV